jgi:hypothetical protein
MAHSYVVLPSNSSMEYFPDNTLANFKVKLAKPLILEGQYEVALVEIIYPHRRLSVQPDEASIIVYTKEPIARAKRRNKGTQEDAPTNGLAPSDEESMDIVAIKTPEPSKKKKVIRMSRNSDGVMKAVEKSAAEIPKTVVQPNRYVLSAGMYEGAYDLNIALYEATRRSAGVKIGFDSVSNKFRIRLTQKAVKVELSPRMSHLLGFTNDQTSYILTQTEKAKFLPHLEGNAHSLYVYSSIVDHQIVGGLVAPLLRVVCPDADKLGQTVSEKYIKPHYLPVNNSYIDTIDIQIRTTTGYFFPFLSGSPIVISLHFKPRNG